METPTKKELLQYVNELTVAPYGTKGGINRDLFVDLKVNHEIADYGECIRQIKLLFDIPSALKIGLKPSISNPIYQLQQEIICSLKDCKEFLDPEQFFELTDVCLEERIEPAYVLVSDQWPLYGTKDFENMKIEMFFKRWIFLAPVETAIFVISHEMAHVLLYALKHPQRKSEFATDVLATIISGPEIMRRGRKIGGHTFGYLNDEQFDLVCNAINRRLR